MALEVSEVSEEKGSDKVEAQVLAPEVVAGGIDENVLKLIKDLQTKVSDLESEKETSNSGKAMEMIAEALDKLNNKSNDKPVAAVGQYSFDTGYTESDIDEDDVLDREDWVTFVSHQMMNVIVDDKRHGRSVRAPFDKIVFKYVSTRQVKNGNETEIYQISAYTCRSKKELEWLRNHSMFNITFYDKIESALTESSKRASRIGQIMMVLKNMNQNELISMAKQNGLAIGTDINILRGSLATFMMDQEETKQKGAVAQTLAEQQLEADLIGKTVK